MSFQVDILRRRTKTRRRRGWLDRFIDAMVTAVRWPDVATWVVAGALVAYLLLYAAGLLPGGCAK